jgi:galactokinase
MYASHSSCADVYQCSHVQLDKLVQLSRKYGALGARLTGAGWGGCIVALVRTAFLDSFIQGLEKEYYSDLPAAQGKERMEFIFPTKPGGGAEIYSVA